MDSWEANGPARRAPRLQGRGEAQSIAVPDRRETGWRDGDATEFTRRGCGGESRAA
jgi:hypothetical protein